MNVTHSVLMIAVIAMVTIGIRFLPFLLFGRKQKTPKAIAYLGRVLPYAIMGMLVIYCYKGISLVEQPYGIPASCGSNGSTASLMETKYAA